MSKLSRIVYHVDMNSHPVSIHGMKTVYTAVADPGEGHGRPPPSHLRVWMNAPPPPSPYLKVRVRHCSAPESGTETYPICGDPLSRSTRRSFAPLQNLRRNLCVKRSLTKPHPIWFSCQCKSYPVLCIDVVVQFYPWFNWVW